MAVNEAIKYADMTDEQIAAIKRRIETFVKGHEFFDRFVNHVKFERGSKTMKSRRVVRPLVQKSEVAVSAELVAPRPQKIVVETFSHSVDIYRDKVAYSKEDVLYGYDDIVKIASDTLSEIGVQKLDYIKGDAFLKSACAVSYDTSFLKTLAKAAIILKKNHALPWSRGKYLAILAPEALEAIRVEIENKGVAMTEATKEEVESGIVGGYGRWLFAECPSDLLIKNSSTQYLVLMGRRPSGESPIDCAKIEGVEIIHNPLGSGVLLDVDGNYTSDDNKQKGSVAMNINGLGCYINDDLCVLTLEASVNEISKSVLGEAEKSGYVSHSFSDIEITLSAGSNTTMTLEGARYDSSATKWYGARSTIVMAKVSADAGNAFASNKPATTDWSVTSSKGAKIVGFADSNKTCFVELSNGAEAFTITCSATAS